MDFTDKGIQVVKLTPEYFAKNGWDVHYVVTRDNSKNGSYHYQDEVSPEGVHVHRSNMPSSWIGERLTNHLLRTIYSKLRGYAAIIKLAWLGHRVLRNNKIDVIYGGGPHGTLAAHLLTVFGRARGRPIVSRFYGTFLAEKIILNNFLGIVLNWDEALAFRLTADLVIVTNDGTRGDVAARTLHPRNIHNLRFWVNGVNVILNNFGVSKDLQAVTICRLVSWKRVDRALACVAKIVNDLNVKDFIYHVVGDGPEFSTLKRLAHELGIENNVVFHGALKHEEALKLLLPHEIYLSTYDLSNVGNPLLEAIRANKFIFTLNNGDTSSWIKHGENGFIYDVDDSMIDRMAQDIVELINAPSLRDKIKKNIRVTEKEKLWTWGERMQAELSEIDKLVSAKK
jgi:glycosyltransferase involved in cell wall biosynthesis